MPSLICILIFCSLIRAAVCNVTLSECSDKHEFCVSWARTGECNKNPSYMGENCCRSCNNSANNALSECSDKHEFCVSWARTGECDKNPLYMENNCCLSCNNSANNALSDCSDSHERCQVWASRGECEKSAVYMLENCCASCDSKIPDTPAKITKIIKTQTSSANWLNIGFSDHCRMPQVHYLFGITVVSIALYYSDVLEMV
ncbi:putative tyrosinase-like protein tyr-3 [Ditylenchus destructor]|uniref:Tyrosinase-like protein tyr-3 n=1 Tax=Ditylenchus destructor TaxID=166010 RepID=A0AAD4QXP2_9BILA|nr:putative tyrosinase-like protein tyr-3 [Ditylenchus destructor]